MEKTAIENVPDARAEEHAPDLGKWLSTTDARQGFVAEHEASFWTSIRQNKRAVMWSLLISTSIIMEGYDTSLLSSYFAYPSFQKAYGQWFPDIQEYQLTSAWQSGLINASNAGVIIGGFINGWASARFGYKRTIIVSMIGMAGFLFVVFFSPNATVLAVGEILCGITWGVFATTGPAYASEVCPLILRGYLTIYVNLCWATGQLMASGVLKGLLDNSTQWSYRVPWAIQWVWPPILLIGCIFSPESPWWLIKQGRLEDAQQSLHRLSDRPDEDLHATLSQMVHTIEIERETEAGGSYLDCFRGTDLRRTEICCFTFMTQMLAGAQFAYGPTYFFEQAGMSTTDAYDIGVGSTALMFLCTMISWILVSFIGRRTIYLTGIATLTLTLLIIGIISVTTTSKPGLWAQATLCMFWQLVYALSLGPVCYTIISETSAIRLRAQTVVLARNAYNLTAIWCSILENYAMNPTALDWKGKTAFFWAGTAALMTTWVFFRLPECRVSRAVTSESDFHAHNRP